MDLCFAVLLERGLATLSYVHGSVFFYACKARPTVFLFVFLVVFLLALVDARTQQHNLEPGCPVRQRLGWTSPEKKTDSIRSGVFFFCCALGPVRAFPPLARPRFPISWWVHVRCYFERMRVSTNIFKYREERWVRSSMAQGWPSFPSLVFFHGGKVACMNQTRCIRKTSGREPPSENI